MMTDTDVYTAHRHQTVFFLWGGSYKWSFFFIDLIVQFSGIFLCIEFNRNLPHITLDRHFMN